VGDRGIKTDTEKVSAITDLPPPTTTKEVHCFLGMASWYKRFLFSFTEKAGDLQSLTRKGQKFVWNEEHQDFIVFNIKIL